MPRDTALARADHQFIVEAYTDRHHLATVCRRHRVAVTTHVDVGVPPDVPGLDVARIEAMRGKWHEGRSLALETLRDHLFDGAVQALVGLFKQPRLQELAQMRPALEVPVALEEVLLDVAHQTLHLAFGAWTVGPAGLRHEAVMAGQLLEAFVEAHGAGHVCGHGCLVVVDPYLPGDAAEPGEGSHQTLTGVLGITARRRHDVEAPRVAQHADGNMDSLGSPGDGHDHFAPVMLQLFGGLGLEAYRGAAGSQGAPGLDVGTQDANLAVVSQGLDLAVDDHRR